MTGFTVAAILFLPAPGSSLDARNPYILLLRLGEGAAPSILFLSIHLRPAEPVESGFPSSQHKKKRPMLQNRPPNVNKLPPTVFLKLAEQHARCALS
jgi:hypothetical protein